jgi:LacI family transcriptional regulator
LKTLAEYLDLSPATVSFVLNDAPNRSIPESTRERVRAAAKKFNYQPSLIARSLQGKRTQTVGILLPDLGDGYQAQVIAGAADVFMAAGYVYFTAHHRRNPELLEQYPRQLSSRGVEGFLLIDTALTTQLAWPTVVVGGQTGIVGVTNVVVDNDRAAELTLDHLIALGHTRIAFMRGQDFTTDARPRWEALMRAAQARGLTVDHGLTLQLVSPLHSPEMSYGVVKDLLAKRRDFTAVVCFSDLAAVGCVRALHDAGCRVPQDVSVVGFDDIEGIAYVIPSLTTVHQPMTQIGAAAARVLLAKMKNEPTGPLVKLEPQLVVRESTGKART